MDGRRQSLYFPAMNMIPVWHLYGEASPFPDILHIERIVDRAAGMDWRIAPHRHSNLHQILLIRWGSIAVTIDGQTVTPGLPMVLNIPPGTVHGFVFSAGTDGHVLTLPTADFPELFGPEASLLAVPFHVEDGGLSPAFERIAALHGGTSPLRNLRLRAAATELVCDLSGLTGAPDPLARQPRLARLEELIRSHLADGWSVSDYASALNLSDRHLRRLCMEALGLSAHGFIEQVRLREACRLLAYTRMQVQMVAYALGFEDQAYFTRTFRRCMGLSPTEYRRRLDAGERTARPL
jgi:AraC family transcriptional regulator, transcriptional activator of pobA